jgi:hypothetical protein
MPTFVVRSFFSRLNACRRSRLKLASTWPFRMRHWSSPNVTSSPGGGIHSVTDGLINSPSVVVFRLAFRDQVAGAGGVETFERCDVIEVVICALFEKIAFTVSVCTAVPEVIGARGHASGRAIDVLSLFCQVAVSAVVAAVVFQRCREHHVVAGRSAAGRVAGGGSCIVSACVGLHRQAPRIEDRERDCAAGSDGPVAAFHRVVAEDCFVVVGAFCACSRGEIRDAQRPTCSACCGDAGRVSRVVCSPKSVLCSGMKSPSQSRS